MPSSRSTNSAKAYNDDNITIIDIPVIDAASDNEDDDVADDDIKDLLKTLRDGKGDEIKAIQAPVQKILKRLASKVGDDNRTVIQLANGGLDAAMLKQAPDKKLVRTGIDASYNPDHVVISFNPDKKNWSPILLVEGKVDKGLEDAKQVAKFVEDLVEFCRFYQCPSLPGVAVSQKRAFFFEAINIGDRVTVFEFSIVLDLNMELAKVFHQGIARGTFFGGTTIDDARERFIKVLASGATSIVFETADSAWPIAKVVTKDSEVSFLREIKALKKLESHASFLIAENNEKNIIYFNRKCTPIDKAFFKSSIRGSPARIDQLLNACEAMHAKQIVHNDLRLDNIMTYLDESNNERLVVGDFGYFQQAGGRTNWLGGTIKTASPLLLEDIVSSASHTHEFSPIDDLWSVASLCMHSDDDQANTIADAAAYRFAHNTNGYDALEYIRDLWEYQSILSPAKWGAIHALLTKHHALQTAPKRGKKGQPPPAVPFKELRQLLIRAPARPRRPPSKKSFFFVGV